MYYICIVYFSIKISTESVGIDSYRLFYFFNFTFEPVRISLRVHFFGDVCNGVPDYILDRVLIKLGFFCFCHEMFTSIVRTVIRIQIDPFHNRIKTLIESGVSHLCVVRFFFRIHVIEEKWAIELLRLQITLPHKTFNSGMNRNNASRASSRLYTASHESIFQINILKPKQAQLLRSPSGIALNQQNINALNVSEMRPQKLYFLVSKRYMFVLCFLYLCDKLIREFECTSIISLDDFIFQSKIEHEIEQRLDAALQICCSVLHF